MAKFDKNTMPLSDHLLYISFHRQRVRDKSERATVEQVLDPRTRMILFKFLNKGTITEVRNPLS